MSIAIERVEREMQHYITLRVHYLSWSFHSLLRHCTRRTAAALSHCDCNIMQGLPRLTVAQLNRLLTARLITSEQICSYCYTLAVAGEDLWKLHAFERLVSHDELLNQACLADQRRKDGASLSLLDGIPVSIKANIAIATQPLTAGSKVLGACIDRTTAAPAVGYSADVSRRLLDEGGAVLVGVTTLDEFGMGSLGTNKPGSNRSSDSSFATKNPLWLLQRIGGTRFLPDDEVAKLIRSPTDAIFEAHANAIKDDNSPHISAGGSSCGGAASVSHGSSIVSLGSDTGGSVRLPAAWCGVTGLKPSYGLLSRDGLVSYASSMDTIGILAPSVHCAGVTLEHLSGGKETHRDSTHSRSSIGSVSYAQANVEDKATLEEARVGIPEAFSVVEAPDAIRDAWLRGAQILEQKGAIIETVSTDCLSPEVLQRALAAYHVAAAAEASSNLARYDGFRYGMSAVDGISSADWKGENGLSLLEQQYAATRTHGFGSEVIRRILCGTSVLSSDRFHTFYEAAAKLRAVLTNQLHETLTDYDLLLVPTALLPPPEIRQDMDQTEMFANDVMTVPISMAGLSGISVPFGVWEQSSPAKTALQLAGSRHNERLLLSAAQILQESE